MRLYFNDHGGYELNSYMDFRDVKGLRDVMTGSCKVML